jgi:hypothetical protein
MLRAPMDRELPVAEITTTQRWGRLAVVSIVIGLIWLVVLPIIGEQPYVSEHIATQQRLGINPSAMYYTELQMAPDIAGHIERLHDSYSEKFWTISKTNAPK